jgi:hypothetical protein
MTTLWAIIASDGHQAKVLVHRLDEVTAPTGPGVRETDAAELTVVIQLYALTGCIVRHGTSVQVVTGAAYVPSPTFA